MRKTTTENLHSALERAKKKWFDHLAVVKKAAIKVMPELGGSAASQPAFSYSVSDRWLHVNATVASPDATSPQFGVRRGLEFSLSLELVDSQDYNAIVRSIRKQQLACSPE